MVFYRNSDPGTQFQNRRDQNLAKVGKARDGAARFVELRSEGQVRTPAPTRALLLASAWPPTTA
jgi:hypothetical protein